MSNFVLYYVPEDIYVNVVDVQYDSSGYPVFLVYFPHEYSVGGEWKRISAKHFRPER